jgi:hypothetical protein
MKILLESNLTFHQHIHESPSLSPDPSRFIAWFFGVGKIAKSDYQLRHF